MSECCELLKLFDINCSGPFFRHTVENLLYQGVETDASARPTILASSSCDLDLWPPEPEVDRFVPLPHGQRRIMA